MFRRLPHSLRRPRPEDISRVSDDNAPEDTPSEGSEATRSTPRNPTDVLDTIHWLQRASRYRLPNELIKLVIHDADYDCIHFRASRDTPTTRFSSGRETPLQPYLETKPLNYLTAGSDSAKGRIQRVTVKATGHDQGWCQNHDGGSWTWFELGKKSVDGEQERGPEWARNAMANKEPQDHELVYGAERPEETTQEIRAWVQGLQNGDAVSVVPMARFSGWSCNAVKASIDIEVEVWW